MELLKQLEKQILAASSKGNLDRMKKKYGEENLTHNTDQNFSDPFETPLRQFKQGQVLGEVQLSPENIKAPDNSLILELQNQGFEKQLPRNQKNNILPGKDIIGEYEKSNKSYEYGSKHLEFGQNSRLALATQNQGQNNLNEGTEKALGQEKQSHAPNLYDFSPNPQTEFVSLNSQIKTNNWVISNPKEN